MLKHRLGPLIHSVLSPSKCNRQKQHKGRIIVQTAAVSAFVSVQQNTSADTRAPFSAAHITTPTSSILPPCKCGDACRTANAILFVYPERRLRSLWGRCEGEKRERRRRRRRSWAGHKRPPNATNGISISINLLESLRSALRCNAPLPPLTPPASFMLHTLHCVRAG